jgi:hypothetical protein
VGCFPASLNYGEPEGHYPLTAAYPGGSTIEQLEAIAQGSLIARAKPGTPDHDAALRSYAETREMLANVSYDMFGWPGLRRMQAAYADAGHARMLEAVRQRIGAPDFIRATKPLALAKLHALVRRPERFVPCPALKHEARG